MTWPTDLPPPGLSYPRLKTHLLRLVLWFIQTFTKTPLRGHQRLMLDQTHDGGLECCFGGLNSFVFPRKITLIIQNRTNSLCSHFAFTLAFSVFCVRCSDQRFYSMVTLSKNRIHGWRSSSWTVALLQGFHTKACTQCKINPINTCAPPHSGNSTYTLYTRSKGTVG